MVDVLKICCRSRGTAFKAFLQQSSPAAEAQCRPRIDRCSRCWMSYDCQKFVGQKRLVPLPPRIAFPRGLQTLSSVLQRICKKYDHNGTECCSDE